VIGSAPRSVSPARIVGALPGAAGPGARAGHRHPAVQRGHGVAAGVGQRVGRRVDDQRAAVLDVGVDIVPGARRGRHGDGHLHPRWRPRPARAPRPPGRRPARRGHDQVARRAGALLGGPGPRPRRPAATTAPAPAPPARSPGRRWPRRGARRRAARPTATRRPDRAPAPAPRRPAPAAGSPRERHRKAQRRV
jgi:hypothetical protein